MALVEVPTESGMRLLVEASQADVPDELVLAAQPGRPIARLTTSLESSLAALEPALRDLRRRLSAVQPSSFTVEFGIKVGGETGIILTKGVVEANFTVTMHWDAARAAEGRVVD